METQRFHKTRSQHRGVSTEQAIENRWHVGEKDRRSTSSKAAKEMKKKDTKNSIRDAKVVADG
jgi:hypothetical protein